MHATANRMYAKTRLVKINGGNCSHTIFFFNFIYCGDELYFFSTTIYYPKLNPIADFITLLRSLFFYNVFLFVFFKFVFNVPGYKSFPDKSEILFLLSEAHINCSQIHSKCR